MAALNLFRFFRSARSQSKSRRTFRPVLEALDSRDVPAVLTWTDATGDDQFFTPGNWTSSDIPSSQPQLATPHEGDDLLFVNFGSAGGGGAPGGLSGASGPQGGSPNCYGMQSDPAGPYNSIFVTGGYTGTITVTGPVQTLALQMLAPATIDQPTLTPDQSGDDDGDDNNNDITVLTGAVTTLDNQFLLSSLQYDFSWTAGTINSTSNLSNLWLQGSTASINPGGGTLTTGDNISLDNGTVVTMGAGTVTLTNVAATMYINANSGFVVDPGPGGVSSFGVPVAGNATPIPIAAGGWLTLTSGMETFRPILVNGGTFTLAADTLATILDGVAPNTSYVQTSGTTYLTGGSILAPGNGMTLSGGKLSTLANSNGSSSAEVNGDLTNTGADVVIGDGTLEPHVYGTLTVHGIVLWTGGTYRPVLDGEGDSRNADLWLATGAFTIGGTASLAPGAIDGEGNPMNPDNPGWNVGWAWLIIEANGGIAAANGTPTMVGPWIITPDLPLMPGDPTTQWLITSV